MSYTVGAPTYRRVRRRRKRRRHVRRWLALLAIGLLGALAVAIWTALPAIRAVRDARAQVGAILDAAGSLRRASSPAALETLDAHDVRLIDDIRIVRGTWNVWRGPALLASQVVPGVHRQLEQVDPLLDYGRSLAQAGHLLSGALAPVLASQHGGLSRASGPALIARVAAARVTLRTAGSLLERAERARRHITLAELPATVQEGLRRLDPLLPQLPPLFDALPVLPRALGADGPRDYLVVPQNSEDLRASGGFIGTVGVVRVDHGHPHLINAEDSYFVDRMSRPNVDPPLPIGVHGWVAWYFRDANWSADFPTTARLLETFYQLGTHRHVDGVIAFDSLMLPDLLNVTGPVSVPGYHETLTAGNAFQRIDYHVNVLHSPNKAFAVAAYKATFARLHTLSGRQAAAALAFAADKVRSHDLLLYADDPTVEKAIVRAGAGGAINPTMGDYLYVVDTNTSMNKVNQLVRERISYHATIQPDRSILATTTVRYTNDADRQNLPRQNGKPFYSDFVRLYVPAGSTLLGKSGLDERWPTYTVHNKTQFSGYFTLPSHRSRTLTFRYRVPANVDPGRSYSLLIQKQPGTGATPLQIRVSAGQGVHLGNSGVRLRTALRGDVTLRAPLAGGTPHLQRLAPGAAEQQVVPGSHPEPWVTVPTGSVAPF
jgi:Protein of unknown function (DUF4012)